MATPAARLSSRHAPTEGLNTRAIDRLPVDVVLLLLPYLGQSSVNSLYRTNRSLWHVLGQIHWRRISIAPHPLWVELERDERIIIPSDTGPPVMGQVFRGFHRTSRLLSSYTGSHVPGVYYHARFVEELTIGEVVYGSQLQDLLTLFSNVSKLKLLMGDWLYYRRKDISTLPEDNFEISHGVTPPPGFVPPAPAPAQPATQPPPGPPAPLPPMDFEMDDGEFDFNEFDDLESDEEEVDDQEPFNLFGSIWLGLSYGGAGFCTKSVTYLEIENETFMSRFKASAGKGRAEFGERIWRWFENHNVDPNAFYTAFPCVEQLKCPAWFLELLFEKTVLRIGGRRWAHDISNEDAEMFGQYGVTGWPQEDFWPALGTLTVTAFDEFHEDGLYTPDESIIPWRLWSFLTVFRGLHKIRAEEGNGRVLQEYPGGYGFGRRVESLVSLSALMQCQQLRNWDVHLGDFDVNLVHLEILMSEWPAGSVPTPAHPVRLEGESVARLFAWIPAVGWTGFMRVPDTTDYWGDTMRPEWLVRQEEEAAAAAAEAAAAAAEAAAAAGQDVDAMDVDAFDVPVPPVPPVPEIRSLLTRLGEEEERRHRLFPRRIFVAADGITNDHANSWQIQIEAMPIQDLLRMYIEMRQEAPDWDHQKHIGLHFHFEVCWSKSLWHRTLRCEAATLYDSRPLEMLATEFQHAVGKIAITTDNLNTISSALTGLDRKVAVINMDAIQRTITRERTEENDPVYQCEVFQDDSTLWDVLANRFPNLEHLSLINYDQTYSMFGLGGGVFQTGRTTMFSMLERCPNLRRFSLQGTIFQQTPTQGYEIDRTRYRLQYMGTFADLRTHGHKLDIDYLRFLYVDDVRTIHTATDATGQPGDLIHITHPLHLTPIVHPIPQADPRGLRTLGSEWPTWDLLNQFQDREVDTFRLWPHRDVWMAEIEARNIAFRTMHDVSLRTHLFTALVYEADGRAPWNPDERWVDRDPDGLHVNRRQEMLRFMPYRY